MKTMSWRAGMVAIGAILVAGCQAVVEERVETGLTEAGIPGGIASCMAAEWAQRLSFDQIREISQLAGRLKAERQTLTVGGLLDHVRAWNDPVALQVVTGSAARCALG